MKKKDTLRNNVLYIIHYIDSNRYANIIKYNDVKKKSNKIISSLKALVTESKYKYVKICLLLLETAFVPRLIQRF